MSLKFKSGGDPSRIPAIWYDGALIAFWPATLPTPNEDQANVVLRAWMKGDGSALGRQQINALLAAGEPRKEWEQDEPETHAPGCILEEPR